MWGVWIYEIPVRLESTIQFTQKVHQNLSAKVHKMQQITIDTKMLYDHFLDNVDPQSAFIRNVCHMFTVQRIQVRV